MAAVRRRAWLEVPGRFKSASRRHFDRLRADAGASQPMRVIADGSEQPRVVRVGRDFTAERHVLFHSAAGVRTQIRDPVASLAAHQQHEILAVFGEILIGLPTGHKSRELRRYQHLREELKRKTVDLIAGVLKDAEKGGKKAFGSRLLHVDQKPERRGS